MNFFDEEDERDMSIDLTPLLDVLFVFLLFFVITANFGQPMINLKLPKSKNSEIQKSEKEDIVVHLRKGKVYFQEAVLEDLIGFFRKLPDKGQLIFQVEEEENFGNFIRLIDLAKAGGRDDFLIQTQQD